MNPTILGVIGPGFLNQVPTLGFTASRLTFRAWRRQVLGAGLSKRFGQRI